MKTVCHITILLAALLLAACKLPEVQLATEEPIKIDIDVRLDLYQYSGDKPAPEEEEIGYQEAVIRQRDRMEEVQELKNNRFVGENHRGLLTVREIPGGEWGTYVKKTVKEENADRSLVMRQAARKEDRMLNEVERDEWEHRVAASHPGEWIEIEGDQEGTYKWSQVGEKKPEPLP